IAHPFEARARGPERRERLHRSRMDLVGPPARAVDAEQGRVSRLLVGAVARGALAERRRVLLDLEQVVTDLEDEADIAREDVEPPALVVGELAELARHHDRRADQLTGLAPVDVLEPGFVDSPPFGLEIERLAADHARRSARLGEPADHADLAVGARRERLVRA